MLHAVFGDALRAPLAARLGALGVPSQRKAGGQIGLAREKQGRRVRSLQCDEGCVPVVWDAGAVLPRSAPCPSWPSSCQICYLREGCPWTPRPGLPRARRSTHCEGKGLAM
jgi:hypothetical protein